MKFLQWVTSGVLKGGGGRGFTPIGRFSDRSTVKHALQNTQNGFLTALECLQRSPRPPSWFNWGGSEGRMEGGREGRGRNCVDPFICIFCVRR